ncbi:NEK1 [Bugula neritina]|uniref:non-specific serine/threonine protein kinase n=1 Tax=Bugula neritina TaxID=10212 RepID=A0A7J7J6B9_BUGNE|nr:NEK1 [Bugula neritina]
MNMAASAIFDDSSNEDTDVEMDLDLKEREKDTEAEANVEDGSDQSVVKQEMEIDDDVINEDDEDKTLYEAELVALMASQGSESTQESESKTPQFDLISPTSGEEEETEEDILSDEESAEDQQLQDAVDFEKLRETLQQVLVQDDVKKTSTKKMSTAADAVSSIQKDLSKVVISESESGKEEWVSDDSSDGDHASPREEEEDMFCRLEESRANLEKELGEVTFRKAYKLMQALHEDEEESIEEGSKLVTKVLGEQKSHLYDKILHLVVADSAYLDDNC